MQFYFESFYHVIILCGKCDEKRKTKCELTKLIFLVNSECVFVSVSVSERANISCGMRIFSIFYFINFLTELLNYALSNYELCHLMYLDHARIK
jgi:hypothetical protein